MYCLGRNQEKLQSILADFAYSDFEESHIGQKSDPHLIRVEYGGIEKVSFAAQNALPQHIDGQFDANGAKIAPIAPLPYFWHLINNTPTYRLYETFVQNGLDQNVAHLHTGDDYRYYHPIVPGDVISVTCELSRLYERQGRQGPMKFIEDIWQFRNQHNVLVGELVRKAVTVYYVSERKPAALDKGPDLSSEVAKSDVTEIGRTNEADYVGANIFSGRPMAYRHDLGPITWTMMIQWMGAVDDYARTHYDWEYAKERDFPGGIPIVAGPHMGALIIAPVVAWIGPDAWIEAFDHIQRHPIHPNDKLRTYGISRPVQSDPDRVEIQSWLVNKNNEIVNWGTFTVRRKKRTNGSA